MRPLKLSMTAFGPYANKQVIDFRLLNERSFFLIHGPTGAGKTTILDAICFALYGESSGDTRKSEQMRSHHSNLSTATEVSFDFMLGQESYRVTRSLKRARNQDGVSEAIYKIDKAGLWRRTDVQNDQESGTVLASKWTKVTEAIEALFGFECKQFRQVILLPQDQFQKLLMAPSQAREDLFKVLFQTEQFEAVENALKDEAKHTMDDLTVLGNRRKFILDMAEVTKSDELAEKREIVECELQKIGSEIQLLRLREQEVSRELEQGRDNQRKLDERDQAKANLEAMELQEAEYDAKRRRLNRAQRATELIDLEQVLEQQLTDAQVLEHQQSEMEIELTRLQNLQRQAADALEHEMQRGEERVAASQERDRLETLKGQVEALERARTEFELQLELFNQKAEKFQDAEEKRDELQKDFEQLEQNLSIRESVSSILISAKQAELDARLAYERWNRLDEIQRELEKAQDEEAVAQRESQRVENELHLATENRNELEKAWHNSQAAILAGKLLENEPCPVCGSIHHPKPAVSDENRIMEAELQKAQEVVSNLESQKQVAQSAWLQLHQNTVQLDADRKSQTALLGAKAHLKSLQIIGELEKAQNALQEAQEEDRRLNALQQELQPLREQLKQAQNDFDALQKELQEALNQKATAQAIFFERERNVPPELDDQQKLLHALKLAEARVLKLNQELCEAQKVEQEANENFVRVEATLKQITEQAVSSRQRAEELNQQFLERIRVADFLDIQDYVRAKMNPQEIALLDQDIRSFDALLRAAQDRAESTAQVAESLTEPDFEKLESAYLEARSSVEAALKSHENLRTQVDNYDNLIHQLGEVEDEWDKKNQQYSIIGKIADIANGKNAINITFHRFVLSALLDDVLGNATQRLKVMSRGRYILQRSESPLDKRKGSGLDMVISDTWTGETKRPVGTLSGGESFYTSLALALGLADVVQRYAGGIRLDTIFIDEGFGSLDADTLDLAIMSLEDLKEDGRLVGIISHVESLQERIPARLEVSRTSNGSMVKLKMA